MSATQVGRFSSGASGSVVSAYPAVSLKELGRLSPVLVPGLGSRAISSGVKGFSKVPLAALLHFVFSDFSLCTSATRSPNHFRSFSRLNSFTSSRRLDSLPRSRGTVSSGITSWHRGSSSNLSATTRPAFRSRSWMSRLRSLQFTRNCRREETKAEASSPICRWSLRSSMTSTVGPSSRKRYSFKRTSSASSAQSCLTSSVFTSAFVFSASARSTASPSRACCRRLASATWRWALGWSFSSAQVFAWSFCTITANSSRVCCVEKARWKRLASRGWPSASAQSSAHSSK
mmetsp:Transcript_61296/g.146095  ORF Transcript_61296/g.146095 Transcript_61296/m.146095 type:complete len:288 (+) Transcript_61296:301-1164(+)